MLWPSNPYLSERYPMAKRQLVYDWAPEVITGDIKVSIQPAVEPVSIDEFKLHARALMTGTIEDDLINLYLKAARERLEHYLNRAFIFQTLKLTFDHWTDQKLYLPRAPFFAVAEIRRIEADGSTMVLTETEYTVISDTEPAIIWLNIVWPALCTYLTYQRQTYWQVEYAAGYGNTADDVPAAIKAKILEWATIMYETRKLDINVQQTGLDSVADYIVMAQP